MYNSDDYDTDYEEEDIFEALCRFEAQSTPNTSCSSLDSWLRNIEYPASEETNNEVPDLVSEENGNPIPAAPVRYTLPRIGSKPMVVVKEVCLQIWSRGQRVQQQRLNSQLVPQRYQLLHLLSVVSWPHTPL